MYLTKNRKAFSYIIVEDTIVSKTSASELQKYIQKISGTIVPIKKEAESDGYPIFIGTCNWVKEKTDINIPVDKLRHDGYIISCTKDKIVLTGQVPRSVLYATYELLQKIGCRWYYPGTEGEFIPDITNIQIQECEILDNPDFEIRSFVDAGEGAPLEAWIKETAALLDWMGKSKLNTYQSHGSPVREISFKSAFFNEFKRRGLRFEGGGHGTENLVDRSLFEEKPEMFRMVNGERKTDGNFCPSNDEAIKLIGEQLVEYLKKHPEISALGTFFDDVFGGSWCDCEKCHGKTTSQQAYMATDKIADYLKGKVENCKLIYPIYHDTLDTKNLGDDCNDSILGFFCPRERCYAHSIDDKNCKMNSKYYDLLRDCVNFFGNNTYIFEYYCDIILYNKMMNVIPDTIINDLKAYHKLGISKISSIFFGRFSWFAYSINLFIYARAAWNVEADIETILNEYSKIEFVSNPEKGIKYIKLLEKASKGIFSFCEHEGIICDIRDIPPVNLSYYEKHLSMIKKSIEQINMAIDIAKCMLLNSNTREAKKINEDLLILSITLLEAKSTYNQMQARYLFQNNKQITIDEFNALMGDARSYKEQIKIISNSVSLDIKGVNGGEGIFIKHLCDDQIALIDWWMKNTPSMLDINFVR